MTREVESRLTIGPSVGRVKVERRRTKGPTDQKFFNYRLIISQPRCLHEKSWVDKREMTISPH